MPNLRGQASEVSERPDRLEPYERAERGRHLGAATIRAARPDELTRIAGFWLAMFEEVGMHDASEFQSGWCDRFVQFFEERIARGDAAYYVAADGEQLVGSAGALLTEAYPAEIHGLRSGYIFGVYVMPAHRGHGLATELTQATIAFLRAKNAYRIRLHASPFGRRIYERLGFTPTNEMELPPLTNSQRP
jgi:ribosomal protein S18 acetylase RimI-like enzyme